MQQLYWLHSPELPIYGAAKLAQQFHLTLNIKIDYML